MLPPTQGWKMRWKMPARQWTTPQMRPPTPVTLPLMPPVTLRKLLVMLRKLLVMLRMRPRIPLPRTDRKQFKHAERPCLRQGRFAARIRRSLLLALTYGHNQQPPADDQ